MSREFIFRIEEIGLADKEWNVCFKGRCTGEEIIRCNDCKFYVEHSLFGKTQGWCERLCDEFDRSMARGTKNDDFCSHGEKKGGSMSRLIDADSAINEISRFVGYLDDDMILRLQIAIKRLPTIDAVPVVRCKDCIHRRKGGFSRSETDGWTVTFTTPCDLGDEGFCSKGEKVTE